MRKLSECYVDAAKARSSLEKRDVDKLTYEQKICLDFLKKHFRMPVEKSTELMKELQNIGRIDSRQASMIANLMPKTKEDVKLIFSKERTILSDEEINKILETVNKYEK
ncbi:MAG: DNA-directed RNA polymerase subunit F [archaeon]|nr:MAG: DNA-directed RNA polymerase subunit F [archaeon]